MVMVERNDEDRTHERSRAPQHQNTDGEEVGHNVRKTGKSKGSSPGGLGEGGGASLAHQPRNTARDSKPKNQVIYLQWRGASMMIITALLFILNVGNVKVNELVGIPEHGSKIISVHSKNSWVEIHYMLFSQRNDLNVGRF